MEEGRSTIPSTKNMKKVQLFTALVTRNTRWLILKLIYSNKKYIKSVLNFKMQLFLDKACFDLKEENIYKQLALDGIREKEATTVMQKFISKDDIILEAGANIGYYTLLEASIVSKGKGKIYAVEPEPSNVKLLKANVKLNKYEDIIEIERMAFSDKKGESLLYVSDKSNLHSLVNSVNDSGKTIKVKTQTIDEFVKNKNINFIRMDIEGYECKVIHGMEKFLKKKGPLKLFIEIHPHLVSYDELAEMLTILKKNGFRIHKAVSRDNTLRALIGDTKVEDMTIDELLEDDRIKVNPRSFELFFIKD